jgi:hypothetical protein
MLVSIQSLLCVAQRVKKAGTRAPEVAGEFDADPRWIAARIRDGLALKTATLAGT